MKKLLFLLLICFLQINCTEVSVSNAKTEKIKKIIESCRKECENGGLGKDLTLRILKNVESVAEKISCEVLDDLIDKKRFPEVIISSIARNK